MKFQILVMLTSASMLAGCSSISLNESAKVAQAGQAASTELTAYYQSTRNALPAVLEMEVLRASLEPGISMPSDQMSISIRRVQTSLKHRAQIAAQLNTVYSALYELSVTDYAGSVEGSIEALNTEIGSFAEAIGQENPLSDTATGVVAKVFGLIAKEQQKKRVKKANAIIAKQLEAISILIERDSGAVMAIRRSAATQTENTSIALWNTGTVSARNLLSKYVQSDGLELIANETDFTSKNEKLRPAVPALIRYRLSELRDREDGKYAAFGLALNELQSRHREVEQGKPANIKSLLQLVTTLNDTLP